jgi:3',5'-cyclic AMP phosphodiesterase CpdA
VNQINALPERPEFVIHTGDLTHLSTAKEFDTVAEILKGVKADRVFTVPGEHDSATFPLKSSAPCWG